MRNIFNSKVLCCGNCSFSHYPLGFHKRWCWDSRRQTSRANDLHCCARSMSVDLFLAELCCYSVTWTRWQAASLRAALLGVRRCSNFTCGSKCCHLRTKQKSSGELQHSTHDQRIGAKFIIACKVWVKKSCKPSTHMTMVQHDLYHIFLDFLLLFTVTWGWWWGWLLLSLLF